jgi:Tfp pilus assembly major pilin PilA
MISVRLSIAGILAREDIKILSVFKFVVKNEYVQIKPAIEAVKKAKQNLSGN